MRRLIPATVVLFVALFALAAVTFAQDETPAVTVEDQAVTANEVIVSSVVYTGPGWIVIHTDNNGQPGPVIGHSAVQAGQNTDVTVALDETPAEGDALWAMLHTDAGEEGTYEFPGADVPVMLNGEIVMQQFTVTGGAAAQTQATETPETVTETMTTTATPAAGETMTTTATVTATAAAEVTSTATTTAPTTLPTTGGTGSGFSLGLSVALLALGVLLVVGVFALRPRLR